MLYDVTINFFDEKSGAVELPCKVMGSGFDGLAEALRRRFSDHGASNGHRDLYGYVVATEAEGGHRDARAWLIKFPAKPVPKPERLWPPSLMDTIKSLRPKNRPSKDGEGQV